jgi:hypothetical protein
MADGFYFLKMRMLFERYEQEAKEGNDSSRQLVDFVEKFHKICVYVRDMK